MALDNGNYDAAEAARQDAMQADEEMHQAFCEAGAILGGNSFWDRYGFDYLVRHGKIAANLVALAAVIDREEERALSRTTGIDGAMRPYRFVGMTPVYPATKYQKAASERRAITRRLRAAMAAAQCIAA